MTPADAADRADHVYPIRVYYEDTDAGGVVYYANYLKFAERARTELMRDAGTEHARLRDEAGVVFAVRRCEIEYLTPARLDDLLEVRTRVLEVRGASMWLEQTVNREETELAKLTLRLACMTPEGRAARFPPAVRAALTPFC